jgi:hypothetical protein
VVGVESSAVSEGVLLRSGSGSEGGGFVVERISRRVGSTSALPGTGWRFLFGRRSKLLGLSHRTSSGSGVQSIGCALSLLESRRELRFGSEFQTWRGGRESVGGSSWGSTGLDLRWRWGRCSVHSDFLVIFPSHLVLLVAVEHENANEQESNAKQDTKGKSCLCASRHSLALGGGGGR